MKSATVEERSTATLHALNFKGEPCMELTDLVVECRLVSVTASTEVAGRVERTGQSECEVSYLPTIKGEHHLHIKVEGQHINGSPLSIHVNEKLSVQTIRGLIGPRGIAINQKNEVIVSANGEHRIYVFNSHAEKLLSFGTRGSGEGQFQGPLGIAVDNQGNILVADRDNHRIQKFTAEGKFLRAVGSHGFGAMNFCFPYGIAFNAISKKVYVLDALKHHVQVLNSNLNFSSVFGTSGEGEGEFKQPCDIACDSKGRVYIVDCESHCIHIFAANGQFLKELGRHGGALNRPMCVAVDISDMVYVSDSGKCCVSVFTSEGQLVKAVGREGKGNGEFVSPGGVAVDNNGVVFVCDRDHRIHIFL